jgi:hypothetical protein
VIDDVDRQTEEQFARDQKLDLSKVQARYAATGKLDCPHGDASANITVSNDLITTSAHVFIDPKTCVQHIQIGECKFVVQLGQSTQQVELASIEDMGYKCPPALPDPRRDWAVIRLKGHIHGIQPYEINQTARVVSDQPLTTVSYPLDFWRSRAGRRQFPKAIGRCHAKKVYYQNGDDAYFSSDCDASAGSSGGVLLVDVGLRPILLGIFKGGEETRDQLDSALRRGSSNVGRYKESVRASYAVPLRGEFLRAVLKAVYGDEKGN